MNTWYVNLIDTENSKYYTFSLPGIDQSQSYLATVERVESLGVGDWLELIQLAVL